MGKSMDLGQVEACYRQLLQAWNLRDADRFAAFFVEDGHAIGFDGSSMDSRGEIASTLAAVFLNQRIGLYISKVVDITEIAPGVALLRAVVGMVPPDSSDPNLVVSAVQSVIFVERAPDVRVALLQSTPASFFGRPEVAGMLQIELEEIQRSRRVKH
jgi:uncharacterized protein (TIGR02246 family)